MQENELIDQEIQIKVLGCVTMIIVLGILALAIAFKSCSGSTKEPKIAIPLTEQQKEFKESQVSIDTTKNEYSVDGHQLVQYKSGAIMHFSSCRECQKRYNINE